MASVRDADTFELESPFAEDFDALDEHDARLASEAFDETPFVGESAGEPEPDIERMLRLPGRFDDPRRDAAIDKDGTRFDQFLRGRSRHQFAKDWLTQRPRLAEAAREPQADLTAGAITKAWFVIHDVGVKSSLGDKRFKAADKATKKSSVHGFLNRGGYYAATHDFAKDKKGTVYEFLSRKGKKLAGGLTINIETVPDIEKDIPDRHDGTHGPASHVDRYASIGYRKVPGKKVSYYKWTHGAFDTLADLYILASARAGHLLTITAHKEMDRNLGRSVIWREYSAKEIRDATNKYLKKARDNPSDYHGDPFAFDMQALYDCITRKLNALGGLQMPRGARYGVHPLRLRRADGADVGNGDSQLHEFPHQSDPRVKTDTKLKKSGWWKEGTKSEAEDPAGVTMYQPRWVGADDEAPSSISSPDFEDTHFFEDEDSEAALRDEDMGESEQLDWGSEAAVPWLESSLHEELGQEEDLVWLDFEDPTTVDRPLETEGESHEYESLAAAPVAKPLLGGHVWTVFHRPSHAKITTFVTPAALKQARVEVLFYVHGLLGPCGRPRGGMESLIASDTFRLGRSLVASGRPIILVVPQFQDGDDKSWYSRGLGEPEALNRLTAAVLLEVGRRVETPVPEVTNLIIAGHSRAYGVLYNLALNHAAPAMAGGALASLSEIWALDASYGSFPQQAFAALLAARSKLKVSVIYRTGSPTDKFRGKASLGRLTLVPVDARAVSHCAIPAYALPKLLSGEIVDSRGAKEVEAEQAWSDASEDEEDGEQEWEAGEEFEQEGEEFEAEDFEAEHLPLYEGEDLESFEPQSFAPESFEPESFDPEFFEPETLEDTEHEGRTDAFAAEADALTAADEALDVFAELEEETPPKDKVDEFLFSRRSLYKIALVGENLHINLARDTWTKGYTARALTEGGVGAALNAIYMGGVTADRVEKVFAQLPKAGVKYTPEPRMAKDQTAAHAIIISPGALDGLARALNLTRKDMVEAWRLRYGEMAFLEFALRAAFGSFDKLVPHFPTKALAAKRMSVELIKRLIDKHPGSVIEVAKRHPAAAPWRAAFKRNLALYWAEREPQITDLDRWTWARWAQTIFELTAATRDTLNAQILRRREEDRKHARNEHLRPHEIAVNDAAKFILENYEPTHKEKLHTTFWIVHGGLQLTNIKGEPIFLLRVESSRVIYQHLPTKKFYQQTLEGFGDEQLYGIYAEAGRKSQGAIALTKWVIGLAGAVFPVVRYGLMATDVLNAAFKLKRNQAALESSYESIKLAYGNIDKLLPGALPKIWDAVLDKRNAALFNPLQNPDPGAWLTVVIRLVMMRQARVVSGSYASEAVTGFLNKAWKAIKTGLSALWEVTKHVVVVGHAVVGSTGVSGERALALAEERLKKLGVADAAAIVLQVRRLSKADLERLSREVKDLVDNSTKLIDVVRDSLSW